MCRVLAPGALEFQVRSKEGQHRLMIRIEEIGSIEPHRHDNAITLVGVVGSSWRHWVLSPYDEVIEAFRLASEKNA